MVALAATRHTCPREKASVNHSGVELRANLESISHRCHLFEVVFVYELTREPFICPWVAFSAENRAEPAGGGSGGVWGYNPVKDDRNDFTQSRPLYGDT